MFECIFTFLTCCISPKDINLSLPLSVCLSVSLLPFLPPPFFLDPQPTEELIDLGQASSLLDPPRPQLRPGPTEPAQGLTRQWRNHLPGAWERQGMGRHTASQTARLWSLRVHVHAPMAQPTPGPGTIDPKRSPHKPHLTLQGSQGQSRPHPARPFPRPSSHAHCSSCLP